MKLSVITINLNNKVGLEQTIKSVINQRFTDYEYIIIDGNSSDGSKDLIEKTALEHQIKWISEKDCGIYNAMNKGILLAQGEYLLFMNSGDYLVDSNVLTKAFEFGFTEDYVYGGLNITQDNKVLYPDFHLLYDYITLRDLMNNALPHQASFIKKSLFTRVGLYNEKYKIIADWEFCLRAIVFKHCSVKQIPITVSNYDLSGLSYTNPELRKQEEMMIINELIPDRISRDYFEFKSKEETYKAYGIMDNCKPLVKMLIVFCKIVKKLRKRHV